MRSKSRLTAVALVAAALATIVQSCTTVGPDYEPPAREIPGAWHEDASTALSPETARLAGWWRNLSDPVLDSLVQRAVQQGLDLREAMARLEEARARRGISAADRFPTVDATASYAYTGQSKNTQFGAFVEDAGEYAVGFDAAWEVDLWGRVRRSVEAADAELAASVEDARDVLVTVAAETAINYVELRAFQQRLALAQTNVSLQEQTLELVRTRYEAGLVGERDVAQARSIVATTRAAVPAFETGLRAAENRLAVLLGLTPGALAAELAEPAPIPVPPLEVAVGVPADLLRRRADVRRAERLLAAENARIGVAEGDLYPRLALFGNLGVAAEDFSDLEDSSGVFGIGPSLRWNVFDSGRLRNFVRVEEARTEQALVQWERTVLLALEESENAMTAFVREQVRRASLAEAAAQSRHALELAQTQYKEGLSDFQTVLDSERAVALLEDELAQSDAAITTNLVILYKALGGGWDEGAPELFAEK